MSEEKTTPDHLAAVREKVTAQCRAFPVYG